MKLEFSKPFALLAVLLCAGCASTGPDEGVAYKAKLHGAKDRAVKREIKESTATWKLRKHPPSTVGQLYRRMDKDLETIDAIMESRGYYDGLVAMELDPERVPARATFDLELGDQYRFRTFDLVFLGDADAVLGRIKPRIERNQHVVAADVFAEQERILDLLKQRGYPFPKLVKRVVNVDGERKVVDVTLVIDPGELAYFSAVLVEGLDELPKNYIRRQVPWKTGERYNAKEIKDFERKLLSQGLFKSVRVEAQEPAAYTNAVPITVRVGERDKRTIRLGVNYSDIGPGAKAYWEHRNFFGGGERLDMSAEWNPIETVGSGKLTRPGFLDAHQWLVLDVEASRETPDAYTAKKVRGTAMLLRDFTPQTQGGVGVGSKYSLVQQLGVKDRYNFVFFPIQLIYDNRNDRLNPVHGEQVFGRSSYYEDTQGQQSFFKSQLEGRLYNMLWERYNLSSALRLTVGSIDGAAVDGVPADERFYAGGGGSIRGYEYQSVGPQLSGVPQGGDKMLEFSTELRLQPGKKLGYVVFVDGGTVYNEAVDSYNRSLRYGAGLGLRWFTTIGPLRADLAYPLNPGSEQVERLQFYISLGQAF